MLCSSCCSEVRLTLNAELTLHCMQGLVFRVLTYLALRFWNRPAGQQQSLVQWCTNVLLGVLRLAHRQVLKLQRRLEPWVADRPLLRSWLPHPAADPHSSASPEGAWATGAYT